MNPLLVARNCLVFLALLLVLLAGCASLPSPGPVDGGFNLRGKIGVVEGNESFSARILWQQREEVFSIDLWGPLGQGRVRLAGDGDYLELSDADGSLLDSGRAEAVMARQLGWSLPLGVLPHWVRGRPAPGVPATGETRDAENRLVGFSQLDWQVELERLETVAGAEPGQFLPHRLTARRGPYRVRLAISDWEI